MPEYLEAKPLYFAKVLGISGAKVKLKLERGGCDQRVRGLDAGCKPELLDEDDSTMANILRQRQWLERREKPAQPPDFFHVPRASKQFHAGDNGERWSRV